MSLQRRLAAWADRTLLPAVVTILLVTDLMVGFVWLLSPDSAFRSPAYDGAKMLLPMHWHAAVFLAFAALAGSAYLHYGRRFVTGYLIGALLCGLWVFWAVLFTMGALGRPGATYLGTVIALALVALHALSGLALSHSRNPLSSTAGS